MAKKQTLENLFEQIKDIEIIGARLSGEPEVVHEIEDYFRQVNLYPIVRDQIRAILEFVPSVFPENWKSPVGYEKLNPHQKEAYLEIVKKGHHACPGLIIQKVIELAVEYKNNNSNQVANLLSRIQSNPCTSALTYTSTLTESC